MYNFTAIGLSSTIGDSLPLVNQNYEFLDQWTANIQLSATQYWQPLIDLYNRHLTDWNQSLTLAQQNSAIWTSVSTTVESFSAAWLTPLSLFYPQIYPQNTDLATVKNTITAWLNQNFPVSNAFTSAPYYVENQKAIVYNYNYYIANIVNEKQTIVDQTTCSTQDGVSVINCRSDLTGTAFCSNGDVACDGNGSQCAHNESVSCSFNAGPYIVGQGYKTVVVPRDPIRTIDDDGNTVLTAQSPITTTVYGNLSNTGQSYIQANISTYFVNQSETTSLNYFKFIVKDCQWVYVSSF